MPIDWSEIDRRLQTPEEWSEAWQQGTLWEGPFTGPPPAGLLRAIAHGSLQGADLLLNLALAWSQPEMSRAALDAFLAEAEPRGREQMAWLLKRVLHEAHGREAISLALAPQEAPETRSWLVEGLERLALARALSWAELEPVVQHLERSEHAQLRGRVPALVSVLPWSDRSASLLEALLDDDDQEVVTSAAHVLAMHPEAVSRLDPERLERLRNHPSAAVRAEAARLVPK